MTKRNRTAEYHQAIGGIVHFYRLDKVKLIEALRVSWHYTASGEMKQWSDTEIAQLLDVNLGGLLRQYPRRTGSEVSRE